MQRIFLAFLFLACTSIPIRPVGFSITHNATTNYTTSGSGATSSHVITGNAGTAAGTFVLIFGFGSSSSVSTVTGGGLTWTQVHTTILGGFEMESWYAAGDPSSNPFSVTVTTSTSINAVGHVTRYDGADTGNPVIAGAENTGTSTSTTVTITATNYRTGDFYYSGFAYGSSTAATFDTNYIQRGNQSTIGANSIYASDNNGDDSDNVPAHTIPSSGWLMHGMIIKAAAPQVM